MQADASTKRNIQIDLRQLKSRGPQGKSSPLFVEGEISRSGAEVKAALHLAGIPEETPISALAVELLPEPNGSFEDPLGGDLGQVRILRTSPLTPSIATAARMTAVDPTASVTSAPPGRPPDRPVRRPRAHPRPADQRRAPDGHGATAKAPRIIRLPSPYATDRGAGRSLLRTRVPWDFATASAAPDAPAADAGSWWPGDDSPAGVAADHTSPRPPPAHQPAGRTTSRPGAAIRMRASQCGSSRPPAGPVRARAAPPARRPHAG